MKFTNLKKLFIKFLGGGVIKFPTRFLSLVEIDGDVEDEGENTGGGPGDDAEMDYLNEIIALTKEPIEQELWPKEAYYLALNTDLPEGEVFGDIENGEYVYLFWPDDVGKYYFLTAKEYEIITSITPTGLKSFIKGYLSNINNPGPYQWYNSEDANYLNFDFKYILGVFDEGYYLVLDDFISENIGNEYVKIYTDNPNAEDLFAFRIYNNTLQITKNVEVDSTPININGINYYEIIAQGEVG